MFDSKRLRLAITTTLFGALCATTSVASAAPPDKNGFRFANEELTYKVQLRGKEAVRAKIRVGDVRRTKNKSYVPVSANARSTGFFDSVYPLKDRANTFLDPVTFRPLRSEKLFQEAGKKRTYTVDYTHSIYRAKIRKTGVSKKTNKPYDRKYTRAIPGTTHTALSWLLHLRTRDDLKKGAKFSYYIYDGWKLSRLDVRVIGQEDVHTPMGFQKSWKLEFDREILNSRPKRKGKRYVEPALKVTKPAKKTGHIWIGRDARRLPLKISMASMFGLGEVLLVDYKKK